MKKYWLFLCIACVSLACTYETEHRGQRQIRLAATVGDIVVQTKVVEAVEADPYTGATPNVQNTLTTNVWFNFEPGKYLENYNQYQFIPCKSKIDFVSGNAVDATLLNTDTRILYPISSDGNYDEVGDNVYCVGLHPADVDATQDNPNPDNWIYTMKDDDGEGPGEPYWSEVKRYINGTDDIMFAEQMKGNYEDNFDKQAYKHQLTWVIINLNSRSNAASAAWGKVTNVQIENPNNTISIELSSATDGDKNPSSSTISYIGESEWFTTADETSKTPEERTLSIVSKSFGSVFCAPPVATDVNGTLGYNLKVTTELVGEKSIFVPLTHISIDANGNETQTPLKDKSLAVAKVYIINLTFQDIPVIEGDCTLSAWEAQSTDVFLKPQ